jgi:hypothetical protein
MQEELLKEHANEITSLLSNRYGLSSEQASTAARIIMQTISDFLVTQMTSGNLNFTDLADLFNKNTPNQTNPLFSDLSTTISNALSADPGLRPDIISEISSGGLDEILKIFQEGKVSGMDMNTMNALMSAMGSKGGLGSMLGNLGGFFRKK